MIDQEFLKAALLYLPDTGEFIYRKKQANRVNVGDAAGYIDRSTGYRRITINGKKYFAHRLAFLYMQGSMPVGVDHVDHDKNNNSWKNLRPATQAENNKNLSKSKHNTSGHTGVYWSQARRKWIAFIGKNNKPIYLGGYQNIEDAVEARKKAEIKYGYHPNHGRAA